MENYRRKTDPEIGIGTVISYTLPYSLAILTSLVILIIVWVLLGLPLGPGAGIHI
ncbi:AbgT family transporter [Peptoniphilus genitalis]